MEKVKLSTRELQQWVVHSDLYLYGKCGGREDVFQRYSPGYIRENAFLEIICNLAICFVEYNIGPDFWHGEYHGLPATTHQNCHYQHPVADPDHTLTVGPEVCRKDESGDAEIGCGPALAGDCENA